MPEILTSRVEANQVVVVSEDGPESLSPSKYHLHTRASWSTFKSKKSEQDNHPLGTEHTRVEENRTSISGLTRRYL